MSTIGLECEGIRDLIDVHAHAQVSTSDHKGDQIPGARSEEQRQGVWGRGSMVRENRPKGRRGEVENAKVLGCRNRKRRKNSLETVNAHPSQPDGNR